MRTSRAACFGLAIALATVGLAKGAGADDGTPTADARARAAAAFDEGVKSFGNSDYAAAARAFLRADEAIPNLEATENALEAAKRSHDDRLLVEAASRAIARGGAAENLARAGRDALVDATTRLATLELRCSAPACSIGLDGERVNEGTVYALPGSHRLTAEAPQRAPLSRAIDCKAGVAYRFELEPILKIEPAPLVAPAVVAPPPPVKTRPLPPIVFYLGFGATLGLTAATIASGVDAIDGKDDLPNPPTTPQRNDVLGRARRTDFFVGGALLAGAATATLGVFFVQWGTPTRPQKVDLATRVRAGEDELR